MKKIINKFGLLCATATLLFSCSDADNVVYDVFDGQTYGAVLRTVSATSTSFNIFDLNSTFDIEIEEQDEQYGALLDKVVLYASYTDKVDDGVDNNRTDTEITTFPASVFTTSSRGLPTTRIFTTLTDVVAALGLGVGQYNGGDVITFRLELHLTDGRTFSAADGSGSLQGSYFSSPYSYTSTILCIPDAPIPGDYVIDARDTYGDGWQGGSIVVTIDGVSTPYGFPSYWDGPIGSVGDPMWSVAQYTVTVPPGTTSLDFAWTADSYPGECEFEIYGPAGSLLYAVVGPSAGPIPLNLCNE